MKKMSDIQIIVARIIFISMIFGSYVIHGMIEPEISTTTGLGKNIQQFETKKVFESWIKLAIKERAQNDIIAQNKILFSQQNINDQKTIISRLIENMNFPYPMLTDENIGSLADLYIESLADLYTMTYNLFNFSLYPLETLQQTDPNSLQHIPTDTTNVEEKIKQDIEQHMRAMWQIISIKKSEEKYVLFYTANTLTEHLFDAQDSFCTRIFLNNIQFNKLEKNEKTIIINNITVQPDRIDLLALLQDQKGQTLLHILCQSLNSTNTIVLNFTETDKINLIQKLLQSGADPNIPNKLGNTPLHILCKKNVENIDKALIAYFAKKFKTNHLKKQANPNIQDNNGNTPLHILCQKISDTLINDQDTRKKLLEIINILFKNHANANIQGTQDGNTPLHIVCQSASSDNGYNQDIFKLLLQKKANPNIKNISGQTVLHSICSNDQLTPEQRFSMVNMIFAHYDSKTINLVTQDNVSSFTPLLIACSKDDTDLALLFLEKGKESKQDVFFKTLQSGTTIEIIDTARKTPLHYAANRGNLKIVQAILENFRQQSLSNEVITRFINLKDLTNLTAVHCAALRFKMLLHSTHTISLIFMNNDHEQVTSHWYTLSNTIFATKQNEKNITNEQSQYISALKKAIKSWKLPTIKEEEAKETVKKDILKLQDAKNVYTILTQNNADLSLVDNQDQTPQAIFDKYAPVVETALSIIAEKLGLEEATQLKELISPIPAQPTKTEEEKKVVVEQIPVKEQPIIKEEEEEEKEKVVVEQIQEKQSQTFWQKYKTIFAISSILAISVPILYKLYRKYRKQ